MDPDRSFERIYRRHRREVYGSVLRDVRDPDEAEDVTQAAFMNAFRALRRGDRPEKPRAWLLTIARNVVRRRARLRSERPLEVELEADSELLLTLDDPEGSASADIHAALRRLTDAQREVILLREIQGRSYAEIAFELGLSVSAVEALIFRARRALAEELELVERVPVVQPRRQGLFALPGLAKLGSFGFSFGRVSVACMVGCAVVASVPIRDGAASEEPAAAKAPPQHALVFDTSVHQERALPVEATRDKRHKDADDKKTRDTRPNKKDDSDSSVVDAGSLLTVEVPTVEVPSVELPPLEAPTVEVPTVELPPPPPLPEVEDLSELPPLTS